MRLFLIRHGETQWNKWKKLQGQVNIPINRTGEKQAQELAKVLGNKKFDTIYSSPLNRCIATAKIVCGRDAKIRIKPIIKEMAFGVYEGFNFGKLDIDHKHDLYSYFYDRQNYLPPEGAESMEEVTERARIFLTEMMEKHQGETVIAFTHGAFLRYAIGVARNLTIAEEKLIRPINNCSVTVMNTNNGHLILEQEAVDVLGGEKLIF